MKIIQKIGEIKVPKKVEKSIFKFIEFSAFKIFPVYFKIVNFFDFEWKMQQRKEKKEYEKKRKENIERISKKFNGK